MSGPITCAGMLMCRTSVTLLKPSTTFQMTFDGVSRFMTWCDCDNESKDIRDQDNIHCIAIITASTTRCSRLRARYLRSHHMCSRQATIQNTSWHASCSKSQIQRWDVSAIKAAGKCTYKYNVYPFDSEHRDTSIAQTNVDHSAMLNNAVWLIAVNARKSVLYSLHLEEPLLQYWFEVCLNESYCAGLPWKKNRKTDSEVKYSKQAIIHSF